MRTKAKEVLISQTCNNAYKGKKGSTDLSDLSLNRWLDDVAIQQCVNRVSCQVTVIVVVTDIDVSFTSILVIHGMQRIVSWRRRGAHSRTNSSDVLQILQTARQCPDSRPGQVQMRISDDDNLFSFQRIRHNSLEWRNS